WQISQLGRLPTTSSSTSTRRNCSSSRGRPACSKTSPLRWTTPQCLPTRVQRTLELPLPTFRLCSNPTPQPEHSVLPPQVTWPSHPYGRTAPTQPSPSSSLSWHPNGQYSLWKLGITHVLNAAHRRQHCLWSHVLYGSTVDYHGVPADDSPSFDISPYFYSSANFIQDALNTRIRQKCRLPSAYWPLCIFILEMELGSNHPHIADQNML
uniref:Dual specificity protein phosphatase n=1 Tax=Salmo trutta TaxID=8032 RepID=A0A673X8Q5_SALTR